jgi:hypothetical protein
MDTPNSNFQPRKPIQYRPRVAKAPAGPQATAVPAQATPAAPAAPAAPPALKLAGTPAEPK